MGDVVNLRRARKARGREAAATVAAENRAKHGLSKAQREAETQAAARDAKALEGHKLSD